ncbi:hypothetical protein DMP17_09110 [Pseudonocardia sp. TMWB2A]
MPVSIVSQLSTAYTDFTFNAAGDTAYAISYGKVTAFNTADWSVKASWTIPDVRAIALSDDGNTLVAMGAPHQQSQFIQTINTTTGAVATYTDPIPGEYINIEMIGNDTILVVTRDSSQFTFLDLGNGTFSHQDRGDFDQPVREIAESGDYLLFMPEQAIQINPLYQEGGNALYLYNSQTREFVAQTVSGWQDDLYHPVAAISESAGLIAQVANLSIQLYDFNLNPVSTIADIATPDSLVFSPDGQFIYAYTSGWDYISRISVANGTEVERYTLGNSSTSDGADISVSPDGRTILVTRYGESYNIDLSQRADVDQNFAGTSGADILAGGDGDDTYFVNHADDVVIEKNLEGFDRIVASVDYTLPPNPDLTGDYNIEVLEAANGANITLSGNDKNNILVAAASGGSTLNGMGGNDTLRGQAGIDILNGGDGDDYLDGGAGADHMTGGDGDDVMIVDNAGDVAEGGAGIDRVESTISYTLGNDVENLTLLGSAGLTGAGNALDNHIIGNSGNNYLSGGAGNDILDGGLGADRMIGGDGDDVFIVDNAGDVALGGVGIDRVESSITYTILSGTENLTLTGTEAINGTGNSSANHIIGNDAANILSGGDGNDTLVGGAGDDILDGGNGHDILDGGAGADHMIGGAGNDRFMVDNAGDIVEGGEGRDHVIATIDYTLGADVEDLTAYGGTGRGNALNNTIYGGALTSIYGEDGDDVLIGGKWLYGGNGNDRLVATAGDSYLDGGAGIDTMIGAAGSTIFYVDNPLDIIIDEPSYDLDTVFVRITTDGQGYTLSANLENMILEGLANINGRGNALNNVISGNGGNNEIYGEGGDDRILGGYGNDMLDGGAGNDTLLGGYDDDRLFGGAGNDVLNGETGADYMDGGDGNDILIVDNAGDVTVGGAGFDRVEASVSHQIGDGVENLILTGWAAIDGTGNALANMIVGNNVNNVLRGGDGGDYIDGGWGNDTLYGDAGEDTLIGGAGDDILDGGTGADRMEGGAGNDIYYVDIHSDKIVEAAGEGRDTVYVNTPAGGGIYLAANVENAILQGASRFVYGNELGNQLAGNGGDNLLDGGAGNDVLSGAYGRDTLVGGTGNDILFGGGDADRFVFSSGSGTDTIRDFERGLDKIDLSAFGLTYAQLESFFVQNGANSEIHLSSGEMIIIHNIQTGQLSAGDFIL